MYVYLSEEEILTSFEDSKKIWQKVGLIYGDWTGGPNGDGTYELETEFETSEVR